MNPAQTSFIKEAPTGAEVRNEKVRAVLRAATHPLGPTEIARRIGEKWCCDGYPLSSAIVPICRRIGAVGVNGQYTLPPEKT